MNQPLIVKHCADRFGRPLACIHGLPGDGAEMSAAQIRALAAALLRIADETEAGAGVAVREVRTYEREVA